MTGRRARAALLVLLVLPLLAGCSGSAPSPSAWRDQVRQALEDVASEVAVVRLAAADHPDGAWPTYVRVVLDDAARSVTTTVADVASTVPPARARIEAGLRRCADRALRRAVDVIGEVRRRVAAEDDVPRGLDRRLGVVHRALLRCTGEGA